MKKFIFSFTIGLIIIAFPFVGNAQNTITLNALPGGTEGTTTYSDSSILSINAFGGVTYNNSNTTDDWGVTASTVTPSGALNKTFGVTIGGMSTVNTTEGRNYGQKLTDGGIDRASDGSLGIRSGLGGGIDNNEGLNFGLDLTSLSSTASIQITKIYVRFAGGTGESGVLVSRLNPSIRIVFGNSTTAGVNFPVTDTETAIDVSSFSLFCSGGSKNTDLVAIFNNSQTANNFRITKIELKVVSNSFNLPTITNTAHPRLLLKAGGEALIQSLINTSPEHKKSHDYIIETANSFLTAATIVKPANATRVLEEARKAIEEIFFLSYAYRMTKETKYLVQAEKVINDVCNWDNWITYSLDTSEMTFGVAIGYDWLYNDLTAATRQKAREKIVAYGFKTQKTKSFWTSTSNWNQVCIGALSCSALAIYGDGTNDMNTEAAFVLNNVIAKNPNSINTYMDGIYPEGPMYWSYGTTYQVLMLSALEGVFGQNHEGINRLTYTPGFLKSAEYMQFVTGPTSLYFNYSDSTSKRIPLPAALWMAKKANKPEWLTEEKKLMQNGTYASNFGSRYMLPLAIIYGLDIPLGDLPDPQAKLWSGNGTNPLALVRTDWNGSLGKYMGIKGGTPTYSHGQMDGGFFIYDSQGIRWGMDFGKYDYDAQGTLNGNDFSQTGDRWKIFKVANTNQNTISIKKASETQWQYHNVKGMATIDELYDTTAKRGAKVNMISLLGLNNELLAANRSAYLVDDSYFEVKDYISNGASDINLYWNMVTRSIIETVSPTQLLLTQGGKRVILEVVSSNPNVTFTMATNRSTDPVFYNPAATADDKNPGTVMIGFEANIPANNEVTFTVTIKDESPLPPSSVEPINHIVLDLPTPTTGLEGNYLLSDTSEFHIDSDGDASIGGQSLNYAWRVNGGTDINNADNTKFFFRWTGMATTNVTAGTNYGAMLTPSGMDRTTDGRLGIRLGASTAIDPNEGFNLGFDLSFLPNTVQLQLVKVGVSDVSGNKIGEIINRKDTSKKITFGGTSSAASVKFSSGKGDVNVENLNIKLTGGITDYDVASLICTGGIGGIRLNKFVFKIIDSGNLSSESFTIDPLNPLIIYPNPFTDTITLQNTIGISTDCNVKIYTMNGAVVFNKQYSGFEANQNIKIDLKTLPQGTYLVQLKKGQEITTRKIIKNN
jgi:Secretion system C-terminal sorting domain